MMMKLYRWLLCVLLGATLGAHAVPRGDTEDLFRERVASMVVVTFFAQYEIDRQSFEVRGLVVDESGRVAIQDTEFPGWLPPSQLRDFRARLPGEAGEGEPVTYLGSDPVTGWHFVRLSAETRQRVVPVGHFGVSRPRIGEWVWGIGTLGKDADHLPYFASARLGVVQSLPLQYGLAGGIVGSPGAPVFNEAGQFVGWVSPDVYQDFHLFMQGKRLGVALQRVDESVTFLLAEDVLDNLGRIPESPEQRVRAWAGVAGMQPLDRETAGFLGLGGQGAVVVSDVFLDGPAARAGLQARDIVYAVDGVDLPKLRPDAVIMGYLQRLIRLRHPGDTLVLGIIREDRKLALPLELGTEPADFAETRWEYFSRLGFSARDFLTADALRFRTLRMEDAAIVRFVRKNSPADEAGLAVGDWLKEMDGVPVGGFAEALERLRQVDTDLSLRETVWLVLRDNQTRLLRVRLD